MTSVQSDEDAQELIIITSECYDNKSHSCDRKIHTL